MSSEDHAARVRALDAQTSFAVQAPAGSGKTTLLVQRLLRLLTTVEHPEQIIAITFTRKAAEEMRTRIIEALERAAGDAPEDAFTRATWTLAVAARERDRERQWRLAEQPSRLRIMTIDALCQSLVRQMPVTAGLPGLPVIEDDPRLLYEQAARDALGSIVRHGTPRDAALIVLAHLDNDWGKLESLLADMLAARDQWLRVLSAGSDHDQLEHSFAQLVADELTACAQALPAALGADLVALGAYAGAHLEASPLAGLEHLPPTDLAGLAQWQALVELLLTRQGQWRKRIDARAGFPAGAGTAGAMKARWQETLAALAETPALHACLVRVQQLPASLFGADEWTVVSALITLLKTATAHLSVSAAFSGRSDFTAFSMAALDALGEPEAPTDLALSLDYQLRHLLIDEFQDTSVTQFELVRLLTAGWQQGDGRSLFLVGDPMQSIYRFRQADVSLFRRVLELGRIGSVRLEPLTLSVNFRAQSGLVEWINAALPQALATLDAEEDYFVAQTAVKPARPEPVCVYPQAAFDARAEAARVCDIVTAIRAADADASIAVLVRSRTHLGHITSALLAAGIAVAAREIRPFAEIPVIADLRALTRALLHDADRVAWFAVLRAPWCGVRLETLHRLAAQASTIRAALTQAGPDGFAADEWARLARVAAILHAADTLALTLPFSRRLEHTWLALGGPAVAEGAQALRDARAYFDLIASLEEESPTLTAERIAARLRNRFSTAAGNAVDAVQIMTMHGAKGLEFDHVIMPGCGRRPRAENRRLLLWRETLDSRGRNNLLIAPIPIKGESPLYVFLRECERRAAAEETARLLYVAVTRARVRIHCLAHARIDRDGHWQAEQGSFASLLWPMVEACFEPVAAAAGAPVENAAERPPALLLRRAAPQELPPVEPAVPSTGEVLVAVPEFDWAGVTARHVGTVAHRLLQDFAERGTGVAHEAWLAAASVRARGQLRALGVAPAALEQALEMLTRALTTTLASARGQWLFAPAHREACAELCLATREPGSAGRVVIDRTFVDADERRWIIDFKTGRHSGGGLDDYLDSEVQRYRAQLERYARIMAAIDERPIMLGLYFPLMDAWREWPFRAE